MRNMFDSSVLGVRIGPQGGQERVVALRDRRQMFAVVLGDEHVGEIAEPAKRVGLRRRPGDDGDDLGDQTSASPMRTASTYGASGTGLLNVKGPPRG